MSEPAIAPSRAPTITRVRPSDRQRHGRREHDAATTRPPPPGRCCLRTPRRPRPRAAGSPGSCPTPPRGARAGRSTQVAQGLGVHVADGGHGGDSSLRSQGPYPARARPVPQRPQNPAPSTLPGWTWLVRRTPRGHPTTGRARTSRCSPRSPSVPSSASSARRARDPHRPRRGHALCWHAYVPGIEPGQRRPGPRPWAPEVGLRCNPHWLLLDPYAKAVCGRLKWNASVFSHTGTTPTAPERARQPGLGAFLGHPTRTSTGVTTATPYPGTRPSSEMHTKGSLGPHPASRGAAWHVRRPRPSRRHRPPAAPRRLPVELQPVHQFVDEHALVRPGCNHWGYNSIATRAPRGTAPAARGPGPRVQADGAHAARGRHRGDPRRRLQPRPRATTSGRHCSLKGIDNQTFYRLSPGTPAATSTSRAPATR